MQQKRRTQRLHNVALLDVRPGGTVQESRTDQPVSFRELASAQLPRLYSIARRLVGDDAEDAVQECLLKASSATAS
jgi:DNA-directed RNA polymerase specialized sigma24 family protein